MLNSIIYNFKIFFRNKDNFIWNLIFPMAFMAIYIMAMYSMSGNLSELPTVKIAIVEEKEEKKSDKIYEFTFDKFLEYISSEEAKLNDGRFEIPDEKPLLLYKKTDKKTATEWLKKGIIYATVYVEGDKVSFEAMDKSANFDNSMILNEILSGYEKSRKNTDYIFREFKNGNISFLQLPGIVGRMDFSDAAKIDKSERKESLPTTNIYYYAMIAYLVFYPINAGAGVLESVEANYSMIGLRNTISPMSKRKRFFASFLPSMIINLLLTLMYFIIIINLPLGVEKHLGWTLVLLFAANLSALFTGTAIGSIFGKNKNAVTSLGIAIPLFFGFTSGMMNHSIRNMINNNIPLLHKINPVGNTSSALAYLNGTGGIERFMPAFTAILIYAVIMLVISIIGLRSERYESL